MDNEHRHCWTCDEVATLRRRYVPGGTNLLFAEQTGIPIKILRAKAPHLGLTRRRARLESPRWLEWGLYSSSSGS